MKYFSANEAKRWAIVLLVLAGGIGSVEGQTGSNSRLPPPSWLKKQEWKPAAVGPKERLTAQGYLESGEKAASIQNSIKYYNRAIGLDSGLTEAYVRRGWSYWLIGDAEKAMADLNQALAQDPSLHSVYIYRGRVHAGTGRQEAAINDFSQAIALHPMEYSAYVERGKVHFESKAYDSALSDFSRAISLQPHLAGLYKYRAQTYEALGEAGKARADREAGMRKGTGNPGAK